MHRNPAGTLAALALILLAAACARSGGGGADPGLRFEWTTAPAPPRTGPLRISLVLRDAATGRPVRGATIRLEGNMTHPGMVPVEAPAAEGRPGTYEATLDLSMAGDWILSAEASLADGRTAQGELALRGVSAPAGVSAGMPAALPAGHG